MTDAKMHALNITGRNILAALRIALRRLRDVVRAEHYRPEQHYMRGPGPKTRAKQQRASRVSA